MKNAGRLFRPYFTLKPFRSAIWKHWYQEFDINPFNVVPANISSQTCLDLAAEASSRAYPEFTACLEDDFGFLPDKEFVDDLALSTQIVIKKSELLYLHGHLLYSALRHYLATHLGESSLTILETGTARGFSALCMAKALQDAQRNGRILTIDVLHARKPIYWNCIHDSDGKKTRLELLEKWQDLVANYVIFLRGYTDIVLHQLGLHRIHFAFLDSGHDYDTLHFELDFVAAHQKKGDVIVCDDYTPAQFPGVVSAVDELLAGGNYEGQLFTATTERAYMVCRRTA